MTADTNPTTRFTPGTRAAADLPHNCHCGARWSGSTTCHCGTGGCHQSFSSVGAFSRHRRDGRCLDPQTAGLALVAGRAFECWGFPSGTDTAEEAIFDELVALGQELNPNRQQP